MENTKIYYRDEHQYAHSFTQIEEELSQIDFKCVEIMKPDEEEQHRGIILKALFKHQLMLQINRMCGVYHLTLFKEDTYIYSRGARKWEEMLIILKQCIFDIQSGRYDRKKSISEQVLEIVEKRNLTSCMNNTKWKELRQAILEEMPFPPPYILKTLFEGSDDLYFHSLDKEVDFLGAYDEESFVWLNYKIIEWIKVRPCYYENMGGRLVQKRIFHNAEEEFLAILKKYHIPYETNEGLYMIYGYRSS